MARRKRKKRSTAKQSSIIPAWIWLTLGILIGLGIAMFTGTNNRYKDQEQVAKTTQPAITKEPETKQKFDFYTLLPELEIVIPQEETQPPKPKPRSKQQTVYKGGYLLQAGSFKQFNEADSLKARLALIGVQANIQSVEVNQTKWHRVQIGPSQDRDALESLRKRLKATQIDTILLQAKK